MTTKSMGYDHPAYQARLTHAFPALAAGASGATSKFVAFTALTVFALTASAVATGSSTYNLWNGSTTQTGVGCDTVQLIRIMNNAALGAAPSLSTATYGPFCVNNTALGATGITTGTVTNSSAPGYTNYIQLYGTGTTGQLQVGSNTANGGIQVNQGDQLYILRGTDATAITGVSLEYSITPLANVSY
jgi:hypothetical protein